jgi:hypothetical protein
VFVSLAAGSREEAASWISALKLAIEEAPRILS